MLVDRHNIPRAEKQVTDKGRGVQGGDDWVERGHAGKMEGKILHTLKKEASLFLQTEEK